MNDQELLERELNYRPPQRDTRLIKTHPPGYNVVNGLSGVFLVAGFVLGGFPVQQALGPDGAIPAIIAGSLVGLLLAFSIPRRIWVMIGPSGRSLLRPLGCLGSFAIWILCLVGLALFVNLGKFLSGGGSLSSAVAVRGESWQVICDPQRPGAGLTLSLAEARRACAALGPEWRLVRAEDLGFVQANLTGLMWRSDRFRLDEESKDHRFLAYDQNSGWTIVSTTSADLPMKALCIKAVSPVPPTAGPRP